MARLSLLDGAVGKPSVKARIVTGMRPEARRAMLGHGEVGVRPRGGRKSFCEHAFL